MRALPSATFTSYRHEYLAPLRYPETTLILNPYPKTQCKSYANPHASFKRVCFGLVWVANATSSYNMLRYDYKVQNIEETIRKAKEEEEEKNAWTILPDSLTGIARRLEAEDTTEVNTGMIGVQPQSWYNTNEDAEGNEQSISSKSLKRAPHIHKKGSKTTPPPRARNIGIPIPDTPYPIGFFEKVGSINGRRSLSQKMAPLFANLLTVENMLLKKLNMKGFVNGDSIVVMVVNAGEIDLFTNFICSCHRHNISTKNTLVFTGSADITDTIEAFGSMSIYDKSFAPVSSDASLFYLDSIFADMMWYKAFSVWLLLKNRYNVLFQDVDIVWMQNPLKYIEDAILKTEPKDSYPDGFFSDDGQRTLRYSPFYANSGFYYLVANERTEYFAWSIMTAYDSIKLSASHQNVFVTRMIEAVDLARLRTRFLSLDDFPSGIKYHHDGPYMLLFKQGYIKPYIFHMCWTLNKATKIENFKNINMWYVKNNTNTDSSGSTFPLIDTISKLPKGLPINDIVDQFCSI